jgi:hypothetical protein
MDKNSLSPAAEAAAFRQTESTPAKSAAESSRLGEDKAEEEELWAPLLVLILALALAVALPQAEPANEAALGARAGACLAFGTAFAAFAAAAAVLAAEGFWGAGAGGCSGSDKGCW